MDLAVAPSWWARDSIGARDHVVRIHVVRIIAPLVLGGGIA